MGVNYTHFVLSWHNPLKLKNISTYFSAFPEAFEPFIPQNEVLFFNLGKLS